MKGEFNKGEWVYGINHSEFYHTLKTNPSVLAEFSWCLMEAIDVFQFCGIVHGDIKSDNILVSLGEDGTFKGLKFIDFDTQK